jgi:molecular chaperone GrpE
MPAELAELEDLPEEPAPPLEQLAEQLAFAMQKAEEYRDQSLRVQADMENLRRRTDKEVQDARKFALERFAKDLLVVLDSLDLGIQAAAGDSPDVVKLREGSELTLKQFLAVLEKFNVRPVEALGQKFNPALHQAMTVDPSAEAEPNTVVKVFQQGYTLNDRLLRPAMVVIAQKKA